MAAKINAKVLWQAKKSLRFAAGAPCVAGPLANKDLSIKADCQTQTTSTVISTTGEISGSLEGLKCLF
jgi:hypothetical protein